MSVNKSKLIESIIAHSGYTRLPNKLWTIDISPKARIVYAYLASQAESWQPTISSIGVGTGYGRDSVMAAIDELKSFRMIEVIGHGNGLRQEYWLNSIDDWDMNAKYRDAHV